MQTERRFVVDVHSSYTVEAHGPETALGAVLPMVAHGQNVTYSIREAAEEAAAEVLDVDLYAHLTKSAYKAKEAAQILGISLGAVYERVPCVRVGSRRLYPKATIIDVLKHGLKDDERVIQPVQRRWQERPHRTARVVRGFAERGTSNATGAPKPVSVKGAAKMLGISYAKAKTLFENHQIYSVESCGKRIIPPAAIDHFLKGGTPLQFVEVLIDQAKADGAFSTDPAGLEEAAHELRERWRSLLPASDKHVLASSTD